MLSTVLLVQKTPQLLMTRTDPWNHTALCISTTLQQTAVVNTKSTSSHCNNSVLHANWMRQCKEWTWFPIGSVVQNKTQQKCWLSTETAKAKVTLQDLKYRGSDLPNRKNSLRHFTNSSICKDYLLLKSLMSWKDRKFSDYVICVWNCVQEHQYHGWRSFLTGKRF